MEQRIRHSERNTENRIGVKSNTGVILLFVVNGLLWSVVIVGVMNAPSPVNSDQSSSHTVVHQSFSGWSLASNGRDWNSASESEKLDLCRKIAVVSGKEGKGNSANYYYDALNALYDTSDSTILSVSLDHATKLIESGSSALPAKMRKY